MYKKDPISKERLNMTGSEYYDNSIPYKGIYPNFLDSIAKVRWNLILFTQLDYESRI